MAEKKKALSIRLSTHIWDALDNGWMRTRIREPGLTKEEFTERIVKRGLKEVGLWQEAEK